MNIREKGFYNLSEKMAKYYTNEYHLKQKDKGEEFDVWTLNTYEDGDYCIYIYETEFIERKQYRGTLPSNAVIEVIGKHR